MIVALLARTRWAEFRSVPDQLGLLRAAWAAFDGHVAALQRILGPALEPATA